MRRNGLYLIAAALLGWLATQTPARGTVTNASPDFKEIYELLRANLAGVDDAALNHASVQGLLAQLRSRVALAGESEDSAHETNALPIVGASVFEGAYGYVRIGQVGPGLDKRLAQACQELAATNSLKGLVVDLRFAGGQDYAATAAAAEGFFATEQPLIDWGEGVKKSTAKTNALTWPVTLLINQKTSGAAEALAGILREGGVGLLIGSNTAGQAAISRDFVLKNGQRLRVATTPVKVGNGQALPITGLKPDILLETSLEDERAYLEDAYKVLPRAGVQSGASTNDTASPATNRVPRRRMNEAELERMLREGRDPDRATNNTPASEPARPVVQDPALARAIDLLKGLAVVQQFRSF